jgi:hypothetical protein
MPGQNTQIVASDYNAIQAKISLVLGSGSGDYGYGQVIDSTQVSPNVRITVAQWTALRSDILRSRQHQTGAAEVLTQPTTTIKITEADRAAYDSMAQLATDNRLAIPPTGQATRENLVAPQTRTAAWNGVLSQTVTINFTSVDAARYYFNTGSRIEFSGSRVGGINGSYNGPKDVSWSTILTNMGTISFGRNSTTASGTGNNSAIGYAQLTTSDQQIFSKDVTGTTYAPNRYVLLARAPSATQIVFTIQWRDDDTGNPDENVTGTLTSTVQVYRASGVNVSVPLPPATTTGL